MPSLTAMFMLGGTGAAVLPSLRDGNLVALLLVLLLGMALGMCLVALMIVLYFFRARRPEPRPSPVRKRVEPAPDAARTHVPMRTFSRWLAIRHVSPEAIQQALQLHNPVRCNWEAGLTAVQSQKFFITPPIGDWVLVFGSRLPDPAEDIDLCFRFLTEMSRLAGEVQFFSVNRLLQHHTWAWLFQGQVRRAYSWAGKTLWNQGKPTRAELDLDLRCFAYTEPAERGFHGRPDPVAHNCEKLFALAARWSVNPLAVEGRWLSEAQGIAGDLSRSSAN